MNRAEAVSRDAFTIGFEHPAARQTAVGVLRTLQPILSFRVGEDHNTQTTWVLNMFCALMHMGATIALCQERGVPFADVRAIEDDASVQEEIGHTFATVFGVPPERRQ